MVRAAAARGVPWAAMATGCCLAASLMLPWVVWPGLSFGPTLFTTGLAALAAAAAFVLDEPAAEAVDAGPTTVRQRAQARALALLLPVGLGLVLVAGVELRSPFVPAAGLVLQVVGCVALGVTAASVLRTTGVAAPGDAAASGVALVLLVAGRSEPFHTWVLMFPSDPGVVWTRTVLLWTGLLALCAVLLWVTTRDPLAGDRAA